MAIEEAVIKTIEMASLMQLMGYKPANTTQNYSE